MALLLCSVGLLAASDSEGAQMLRMILLGIIATIPAVADIGSCSSATPTSLCRGIDGRIFKFMEMRGYYHDSHVGITAMNADGWAVGASEAGADIFPVLWTPPDYNAPPPIGSWPVFQPPYGWKFGIAFEIKNNGDIMVESSVESPIPCPNDPAFVPPCRPWSGFSVLHAKGGPLIDSRDPDLYYPWEPVYYPYEWRSSGDIVRPSSGIYYENYDEDMDACWDHGLCGARVFVPTPEPSGLLLLAFPAAAVLIRRRLRERWRRAA